MNITQTIIAMLSAHLITDYTLQGWLAEGKQKSWWDKISNGNLPPKYRYDYIAALICHALYWSVKQASSVAYTKAVNIIGSNVQNGYGRSIGTSLAGITIAAWNRRV